jgi:O-antigen ligase
VDLLQTLGFSALALYVFIVFSALLDLMTPLHVFRPALLTGIFGLGVTAISGRARVLFSHPAAMALVGLTFWFIACVPFSVWPSGALSTIIDQWQVTVLTFFLAGGLIWNVKHCRVIVHILGYSALIVALLSLTRGVISSEGRLALPHTRYANPNDLAMILLTSLPCLGYMVMRKGNGWRRPLALLGFLPILLVMAKTGSRGAFIGTAVCLVFLFFQATMMQKALLLLAGAFSVIALAAILPDQIRDRFVTLWSVDEERAVTDVDISAIGSTYSRTMLLKDSITLTFRNPLFGVGPGMYSVAQNDLALERGERKGNWHVTHNTYTQVSSESGLPGFFLFIAAFWFTFRSLRRVRKMVPSIRTPEWEDLHNLAFVIQTSLFSFLVIGLFASLAYLPFMTSLCGLAVSIEFCALRLAKAQPARAAAAAAPRRSALPMPAYR